MRFLPCLPLLMTLPLLQLASGQTLLAEKPVFHQLVPEGTLVEKLAGGFKFVEGPAWNEAGGFLIFSDIPSDKIHRYDPTTKTVTVFREPSDNANGNVYAGGDYSPASTGRATFGGRIATETAAFSYPNSRGNA